MYNCVTPEIGSGPLHLRGPGICQGLVYATDCDENWFANSFLVKQNGQH